MKKRLLGRILSSLLIVSFLTVNGGINQKAVNASVVQEASNTFTCEVDGILWSYSVNTYGTAYNIKPADNTSMIKNGSVTSVIIPDKLSGKNVVSIAENAFKDCTNLTSITVSNNVISIGSGAFEGCTALTSINIPEGVDKVQSNTFKGCTNLTSINIPNKVRGISDNAFVGCTNLTDILISESVTDIGASSFEGCTKVKRINLPKDISWISESAFEGCTSLTSINIPEGIDHLSDSVFKDCTSLENVDIPNGLGRISRYLFEGCTSLKNINIPDSVESIGYYAFNKCSSLKTITIPDSIIDIEECAFSNCTNLTNINIPKGLTTLSFGLFRNCTSLTNIYIPDNISTFDYGVFEGCTNLADINIPQNVTSISPCLFRWCTSLKEIVIPEGIKSIGAAAFIKCTNLRNINIPSGVTEISADVFLGCTNLTSINMPDSVTSIGGNAFEGCTSLTSVNLSNRLTHIDWYVFKGCTSLTSITIPEGVPSLNNYTFLNCTSLKSISIPDSITSISETAFSGCNNLTTIYANSGSYASKYSYYNGKVDTQLGYQAAGIIISTKTNAMSKLREANNALLDFNIVKGFETNTVYKDLKTTITIYPTSQAIEAETDMSKLVSWTTKLSEKIIASNVEINKVKLAINSFTTNVVSPQVVGTAIKLNSTSSGGNGTIETKFTVYDGTKVDVIKEYSTENNTTWTPTKPGIYILSTFVMDGTGREVSKSFTYIINPEVEIINFTSSFSSPQAVGQKINLNLATSGGIGIKETKFELFDGLQWTILKDYSAVSSFEWKPEKVGKYTIKASVKDETGKVVVKILTFEIKDSSALTISSFKANVVSPQIVGEKITLSAQGIGEGILKYKFTVNDGVNIQEIKGYGIENSTTWTPTKTGEYTVGVSIMNENGEIVNSEFIYEISDSNYEIISTVDGIEWSYTIDSSGDACDLKLANKVKILADDSITSITIPDTLDGKKVTSLSQEILRGCSNLKSITIGKWIKSLSWGAFEDCTNLAEVIIPEGVSYISWFVFDNCKSLKTIIIPASVKKIDSCAFYRCTSLESINLKEGLESIGGTAFRDCTSLRYMSVPDSVTNMEFGIDTSCTNLTIYTNSGSYASSYKWGEGIVDTKTGYTAGSLIISAKPEAKYKLKEANKELLRYIAEGGLETDAVYQDLKTAISTYSTDQLIDAETDLNKINSWTTKLNEMIITLNALKIRDFTANVESPQILGAGIMLTSKLSGGTGTVQTKYEVYDGVTWTILNDYSTEGTVLWKPTKEGSYIINASAKDETGKVVEKTLTYVINNKPLSIDSFTTSVATPQVVGTGITLTATASGGTGTLQTQFAVFDGLKWTLINSYSTLSNTVWTPTKAGTYQIDVNVKDATGKVVTKSLKYVIITPLTISSFNANVASPQTLGNNVTLSATGTGEGTLKYKFVAVNGTTTTVLKESSEANTVVWTPIKEGTYTIKAQITDSTGKVVEKKIDYVINPAITINSFTTSAVSPQELGKTITLSSTASGGTGILQTRFRTFDGAKWTSIKEYGAAGNTLWTPMKVGIYDVWVEVKDTTGKVVSQKITYEIKKPLVIDSFTTSALSPQTLGTGIILTATASGGTGILQTKFAVFEGLNCTLIKSYSTLNNTVWTPTKAGTYIINVNVKDSTDKVVSKSLTYVITTPLTISSFNANVESPQTLGTGITLTATASGGTGILQTRFSTFDGARWIIIKDYSTVASVSWIPTKAGSYKVWLDVKDDTGKVVSKCLDYVINPTKYSCEVNGIVWNYEVDDTGNAVNVYPSDKTLTSVKIPSTLDGKKVISIKESAFFNFDNLSSVIIPEGVTVIRKETFKECISLEKISIPSSVTNIDSTAFGNCVKLTTIYTDIGSYASSYKWANGAVDTNKGYTKGSLIIELGNYDTNSDYTVNIIDLAIVARYYNTSKSDMNWQEKYNYHYDDIIDLYDLVKISKKIN